MENIEKYCLYFLCQSPEAQAVNDDYIRYGYNPIILPHDYLKKYENVEGALQVLGHIFKVAEQNTTNETIVLLTELGFLKGTINLIKSNKHQYVKQIAERTRFTPDMVKWYLSRLVLRGRTKGKIA
ncbi:MAG TPA: hypothetical protein CFH83_01220 [Sulfuricurvum kujiense]|uniref:Uncharacterized protein n=1 Tax=Sulfuricurvum kujiense TaxID=148813 RepID=A0A2D3WNL0_9BACT|nr:hypothetical protein [Sulfuricurvum kujiense]DAB39344.1 MAG TPA: hypothetical protein CFH83_01220 [Sulfuricurvum kujiense]